VSIADCASPDARSSRSATRSRYGKRDMIY
jgi:hypothetical protein